MPAIHEIAPDVYRISVFVPDINLAFNHFLVKDEEPLLFELVAQTGLAVGDMHRFDDFPIR